MKIRIITKYLLMSIAVVQLISCDNKESENSLFGGTATERLNIQKSELNDLLESSEYGWKMIYFTDSTKIGGFTHLFKFKNGLVNMVSDFDNDTSIHESEYVVDLGSTVSLIFATKNKIHLLSDPDMPGGIVGRGLNGDFQFLYYGHKDEDIVFRTNRIGHEVSFIKATAKDWADFAKNRAMIENMRAGVTGKLFIALETNDGSAIDKFLVDYNQYTRFATVKSLDPSRRYNLAIAYTFEGLVVKPAIMVKGQPLSNFIYDTTGNNFTAKGSNGITATLNFTNIPPVVADDYKNLLRGNSSKGFGYHFEMNDHINGNSLSFNAIINEINSSLPATEKVDRIVFRFNTNTGQNYIEYRFTGGRASYFHVVDVVEDPVRKTIILRDLFWNIEPPAFLKDLDTQLTNPQGLYLIRENFKILYSNVVYTFVSASSDLRMSIYAY